MRNLLPAILVAGLSLATPAIAQTVEVVAQAPASGTLVLPLANAADLDRVGSTLDAAARAAVARALAAASFDYKPASTLSLRGIGSHDRLLIVGLGSEPLTAV